MILQTTLCLAAAAAVINFWLALRIGQLRRKFEIFVGDGGQEGILRRMRAQANFNEHAPITLILFALVEASGKSGAWLALLGAVFLIGRIAHAYAMDGPGFKLGRPIGMATALLTQLVLGIFAVLIALGRF